MTLELVAKAERIAVLTGAGISTASGIPDFRGPQGVWTKNPAAQLMFDIDEYVASAAVRIEAWKFRLAAPTWTAEPNAYHRALVDLERQGRLTGLITQNIDGLHQKAGFLPALVHELHGTIWYVDCLNCGRRIPIAEVLPVSKQATKTRPARSAAGSSSPRRSPSASPSTRRSWTRQSPPPSKPTSSSRSARLSRSTRPCGLCDVALSVSADLLILNAEPTPYDELAAAVVRTPIQQSLPVLVTSSD